MRGFWCGYFSAVGCQAYPSLEVACDRTIRVEKAITPIPAHVERYNELYPVYQQLYGTLKTTCHMLAEYEKVIAPIQAEMRSKL